MLETTHAMEAPVEDEWPDPLRTPRFKRTAVWAAARRLFAELALRRGFARMPAADPDLGVILLVNHFFDGEIAALQRSESFSARYQPVALDYRTFFRANWSFFPPGVWTGQLPYEEPGLESSRRRSRNHARRVLRLLKSKYRVAAIATPADTFFWVREFLRLAAEDGVPTFVFDKEGVISPATFLNQPPLIAERYPPIAGRFYVWNQRQLAYWGNAGVTPDRLRVIGSLRSDLFVNMPPAGRRGVLYFDFDTWAYLEDLADPGKTAQGWRELKNDLHDVLVDLIAAFPKVPFTIKCHPQQTDLKRTQERFARLGPNATVLTGSVDVHRMVEANSLVVGFQTTGLLEAALTTRPSIYCGWGTLHEEVSHLLLPLMERGFGQIVCRSPEELRALVTDHLRDDNQKPDRDRSRIEEYFDRPDGEVATRYADALDEDLGRRVPDAG